MILPEYLSTVFLLPENRLEELKTWPKSFWIITACNPHSTGERSKDRIHNQLLEKDLKSLSPWVRSITCTSKDGDHDAEPSFAVSGLNFKQVLNAAKKYKQNAVFHIEEDLLTVMSCTEDAQRSAGYFFEKVHSEETYNQC